MVVSGPEPGQPDVGPPNGARGPRRGAGGGDRQARVAAYVAASPGFDPGIATHLLEQNVDIRVIQVLLGHAKLETTALYTRVAINTIRDVKSPLERLGVNLTKRKPPA